MTESEANETPNPSDPSNLLNKTVTIHSLHGRPDLNDKLGTATSYLPDRNRYLIQLTQPTSPVAAAAAARHGQSTPISLKPENLRVSTLKDQVTARFQTAKTTAEFLYRDPNVRRQYRDLYDAMDRKLPPSIKPEHAAGGFVVVFVLCVIFMGLAKSVVLCSLCWMMGLVALPDLAAGASLRIIVGNFPRRWRDTVVQSTGYTSISTRMAAILLVLLWFASANILLTPSPTTTPPVVKEDYAPPDVSNPYPPPEQQGMAHYTLQDIYNLGYNDGTNGNEHGHSFPPHLDPTTLLSSPVYQQENPSHSFDYTDTAPPTQSRSPWNLGMLLTVLAIGRTVKELGVTPDGRFDAQFLWMNVKSMQPWKQAMMGFLVFRSLSFFWS